MRWYKALYAYYSIKLSEEDVNEWQNELTDSTKATGEEIAEAIRWSSFKDRSKFSGKPTLKDIRMWIFWKRKEDGKGSEMEEVDGCAACDGSGWVHSYHGIYYQNGCQIPCACSKGDKWRSMYPADFPENIYKPLAKRAIQEQVKQRKLDEIEAEKMEA